MRGGARPSTTVSTKASLSMYASNRGVKAERALEAHRESPSAQSDDGIENPKADPRVTETIDLLDEDDSEEEHSSNEGKAGASSGARGLVNRDAPSRTASPGTLNGGHPEARKRPGRFVAAYPEADSRGRDVSASSTASPSKWEPAESLGGSTPQRSSSQESLLEVDGSDSESHESATRSRRKSSDPPTVPVTLARPNRKRSYETAAEMSRAHNPNRRASLLEVEKLSDAEDDPPSAEPALSVTSNPRPPRAASHQKSLSVGPGVNAFPVASPSASPSSSVATPENPLKKPRGRPRKSPLAASPPSVKQTKISSYFNAALPSASASQFPTPRRDLTSATPPSRGELSSEAPAKLAWGVAEEKRKAERRLRDREKRLEQRRLEALQKETAVLPESSLQGSLPKLRERKSAPPESPVESPVEVAETPAQKIQITEEVLVPSFRLTEPEGLRRRDLQEEEEKTDDESYDRRHKRTEMQEKKMRNREKERYLHELQKLQESLERQRQMEINERLLKKKSDLTRDSVSPDPYSRRGPSPLTIPKKLKSGIFGSFSRTATYPSSSSPRPKIHQVTSIPAAPPKEVSTTDFSTFGDYIPPMKESSFSLPEYYFES